MSEHLDRVLLLGAGDLLACRVGHPLYFFAFDQPGQTLGKGITAFGGTFRVVDLAGTPG